MVDFDVRAIRSEDWPAIRDIYSEGIATSNATFETATPDWTKWDQDHLQECRLVARDRQRILGWAALSRVSARRVYSGVAEVSVYVAAEKRFSCSTDFPLHRGCSSRSSPGFPIAITWSHPITQASDTATWPDPKQFAYTFDHYAGIMNHFTEMLGPWAAVVQEHLRADS